MQGLISRQEAIDAINKLVDRFERILRDIRETNEDESVCGLCEYDGAFLGQSGDWCNECPGFDRDDCFKLSDRTRKKWIEEIVNTYPDHTADIGKKVEGDCISRRAAIDAICKACSMEEDYHKCDGYPETSTWCDELVALRALQSAQPDLSGYSDKLWKNAYERGKAEAEADKDELLKILKMATFEYEEAWRIIAHPTPDVTYADKNRAQVILDTFRDSLGKMYRSEGEG